MIKASIAIGAVVFIGLSLLAIGSIALVAPDVAARVYGVPSDDTQNHAYVWATATRDIAIGSWLLALVGVRAGRRVIGISMLVTALIPVGDLLIVASAASPSSQAALLLHGASIAGFVVLGGWLWRAKDGA